MSNEIYSKQAFENFTDLPQQTQKAIATDLQSVGLDKVAIHNVFITGIDGKFSDIVLEQLYYNNNVLIFGESGWGKTQIVEQAAEALGWDVVKLTTSTKLPEDFGGRPMPDTETISDNLRRAIALRNLAIEKVAADNGGSVRVLSKSSSYSKLIQDAAKDITEDQITEYLKTSVDSRKREIYAAPDWVYRILDNYLSTGKRTILFLDEINQASPDTLNTLFQLVDTGTFADRDEYNMAGAIVCVAAGNFVRENRALVKIPGPLLRRFTAIIYYIGLWGDSIKFLRYKYRDNQKIVDLLKDLESLMLSTFDTLGNADAVNDFQNPAIMDKAIEKLYDAMLNGKYISGAAAVTRVKGASLQRIQKFIDDNKLNDKTRQRPPRLASDTYENEEELITGTDMPDAGVADVAIDAMNSLKMKWKRFATVSKRAFIPMPDGSKHEVHYAKPDSLDPTKTGREVYIDYLRTLPEFKDIPEDLWDLCLDYTPDEIAQKW